MYRESFKPSFDGGTLSGFLTFQGGGSTVDSIPAVRVLGISASNAPTGDSLMGRGLRALAVSGSLFLLAACSPEAPRSPTGPGADGTEAVGVTPAALRAQEERLPMQVLEHSPRHAEATEHYIVSLASPVTRGDVNRITAMGGTVQFVYDITPSLSVFLPPGGVERVLKLPGVEGVAPVLVGYQTAEEQWGVNRIEAPLVWATEGNRGAGVKVAVLDGGIDIGHPDLNANHKGGANFVTSGPPEDDNGHGTVVAGVIAAEDNGTGVVGVAPEADLYAVKVCNAARQCTTANLRMGINWAKNNGMDVINMSIGYCFVNPPSGIAALEDAVDVAYAAGIVLVAVGGNGPLPGCQSTAVEYPGRFTNVIAVAGTGQNELPLSDWNQGLQIEVAAPGIGITSTFERSASRAAIGCIDPGLGSGYATCTGTSFAAPHVTGVVALMLSEFPSFSPQTVRERLRFFSSRVNNRIGYGIVNAAKSATNTPVATIEGPICLESPGTYTYFANTSGGGGGNFWTWFRRKAGTSTWVNEGTGVSEGIYFRAGSYGDDVKVEVEDRWGKETATITTVFMDSGAGAQVAGGGPTTNATICGGGGGGPPPV